MSEKRKFTLPSALQEKNRRKTVSTEKKLDVRRKHVKGERIVDIYHKVRFTHISVSTYRDKVNRITESAKSGTKLMCSKTTTVRYE